jgi:hypothetical protein
MLGSPTLEKPLMGTNPKHIKYYGAYSPDAISEHVCHEDPEQPCFRGRDETWYSIILRCEEMGIPREQWRDHFRAHILTSPYEGLNHIGGVGVIEGDHLRSYDRCISSEEYEELKGSIQAANEAYRTRLVNTLERENDPHRRALLEHEKLGWRTRVWIHSYTELTHHVPYRVDDSCRAYARVRKYYKSGMTLQLIDLYHRTDGDIRQAIFDGLERAERFADLLALAGFGTASVKEVIGTSPPVCREDVSFEVIDFQGHIMNSPVPVAPEVLEHVSIDGEDRLPLRHLRDGLNADLPTTAIASFWNALERMAEEEARELGRKRMAHCKECGAEHRAGWDTKKGFEAMYTYAGVDADFEKQRALRGRVQHGNTIFSASSPSEIFTEVSRLQSTAIAAVSKRIRLTPGTGEYLRTGTPVSIYNCIMKGDACSVTKRSFEVGAAPSLLPLRIVNRGRTFRMGQEDSQQINPLLIPPVESEKTHSDSEEGKRGL